MSMQERCHCLSLIGQPASGKLLQFSSARKRHSRLSGVCSSARGPSEAAGQSWEAEFAKYADRKGVQRASEHLELTWKVSKVSKRSCTRPTGPSNKPLYLHVQYFYNKSASFTGGLNTVYVHCRMQNQAPATAARAQDTSHARGATPQVTHTPSSWQRLPPCLCTV